MCIELTHRIKSFSWLRWEAERTAWGRQGEKAEFYEYTLFYRLAFRNG